VFRRWARTHKSLVATATSGSLVAVLVAVVAVVSTGYTAQRLDLGDSAVWVANGEDGFAGRVNTEVLELNTVVQTDSADVDVVQQGATVLLLDRTDATVGIVDAATSVVSDSVPLPPAEPGVFVAGDNVVVYSQGTGEVWIMPRADLVDFDAQQEPSVNLGPASVVSVDPAGELFAFSPEARRVYRFDASAGTTVESTEPTELGGTEGTFAVTSVGGDWAVLDVEGNTLELARGVVDLSEVLPAGSEPRLQAPSGVGGSVLVASQGGLAEVPVGAGAPVSLVSDASGAAAAPVVVDQCAYAAWSGGGAWRRCGGADATTLSLESMPGAANLRFQVNQARVVLNDTGAGGSWAVQRDGQLIDNWDDLITVDEDETREETSDESTPPEVEQVQQPPVAVDDEFGARPGKSTLLPVLLNDYDPNADVLVIDSATAIDESIGRVDVVENRQKLQLTLPAGAAGTVSFSYTISDGRGGTASAQVTVTVRSPEENAPPQQARVTRASVATGEQVTVPVLGDWIDPDGDPFYLASATVTPPSTVSFQPEGTVVVMSAADPGTEVSVALAVSDGTAQGFGSLLVSTTLAGEVPIIIDTFFESAGTGEEITISPLEHVRGGSGDIRLNAVPAKVGVTITPSYENGTFRFQTDQSGSHYIEFVVTDSDQTATGRVRVDVTAPAEPNAKPVTVPKTVFVRTLSTKTIDVASTDHDPAGGVLLVTGIVGLSDPAVRAEVLDQSSVRVTLTGPLAAPVTFGYTITNGLADAEGTVTVIEVPPPDRLQPPIARDDTATVRVGDAITIDVLANDEHPDGDSISLNPVLVDEIADSSGLLFASGNVLRYLAPAVTGNFSAVYEIVDAHGQTAQARLTIEVREPNADTNNAPVPKTVVARVIAGERVRIDIPLAGLDPDGDSVQLLGQATSPGKGNVVSTGPASFEYEAGEYSAGTDSFGYTVMDSLGTRATGTVRIGISPRLDGTRNPVATPDEVFARPGSTVTAQPLLNDSDPDGGTLSVVDVQPNDDSITATIGNDGLVVITTPATPGTYGLIYTIENEVGGTSSNFITVIVSDDAPLAYPVASDTVLTLSDIDGRDSLDVDVLSKVFFAGGSPRSLAVSVLEGYPAADVLPNKRVRVAVTDKSQIIPFQVAHPDDDEVRSFAFIWVPGSKDAVPQLNKDAPTLEVTSGQSLTIEINDHVIAADNGNVRITDSSTVRATNSNGEPLMVDEDTLRFTSAELYFGAASVSFEVTDGESASDPAGRTATIVLPITVNPRQNQPPAFTGANIDFEPGEEKSIDLTRLTNYPYADDLDELRYTVLGPQPEGFSQSLSGTTLTLRAAENAAKGSVTAVTLGVRDAAAEGQSGRIQLRVVASTRPLASPAPDSAVARRGQSTVVNVLANDEATNPFPGQPLRVVAVRGIDGGALPPGISVTASDNNSRLTVAVAPSAAAGDASVQYQVADASGDPDRLVWGSVRISVQDVPDAPARPVRQGDGFEEGTLVLRLTAPAQNNSPITGYRVVSSNGGGYRHDCGTSLVCSLPGLTAGVEYRFQVIATNALGDSPPSGSSDPFTVDYLPRAPAVSVKVTPASAAPAGGSLTVSWSAVTDPSPGTPIVGYTVEIDGRVIETARSATSVVVNDLATATRFDVWVYARNSARVDSSADWKRGGATSPLTVGPPTAPAAAPVAVMAPGGAITVSWGQFGANGGATPTYSVRRVDGAPGAVDCSAPATATGVSSPWTDAEAEGEKSYSYLVYADNGAYCSAAASGQVVRRVPPGVASGTVSVEPRESGQFDVRLGTDLAVASGVAERFEASLDGGRSWKNVEKGGWLTSSANSAVYGTPVSVALRGCRDKSNAFCGEASAPTTLTPVNARAGIDSCIAGLAPGVTAPVNAGNPAVSYRIDYLLAGETTWPGSFSNTSEEPVPLTAVDARVRATVTTGAGTFVDPGYGEATACV
jgi:hypothetical protein